MRPVRQTPAHVTDQFAELVCSNSLGSTRLDRALGLLKEEMRRLGSLVIACADAHALPAGGALAVDREGFSQAVTQAITAHPRIDVLRAEVEEIPAGLTILATGPLTSSRLAGQIGQFAGQAQLYFYDALAPIVTLESIAMPPAWRQSRYDRDSGQSEGDYINCPLDRAQYEAFVEAVRGAERIELRSFETDPEAERFFEGCLPIEVLAGRSVEALAFGPMRPVGLRDPRTGRRPYAVVQLRQDDQAGTLFNIVGFQTNIKWPEQRRILQTIPGLEQAEFVRLGQMHRNTFINSPAAAARDAASPQPRRSVLCRPDHRRRRLRWIGRRGPVGRLQRRAAGAGGGASGSAPRHDDGRFVRLHHPGRRALLSNR